MITIIKRAFLNLLARIGLDYFGSSKSLSKIHKASGKKKLLILGTGPSLSCINKDIFKHVDTLSVNGYAKLIKESQWPSPTYYMLQDLQVSEKIEPYLDSVNSKIISSSYLYLKNKKVRKYVNYVFNHYFMDHVFCDNYLPYTYKKTKDAARYITDGYTVVYSAIELAEYLGYEEVYLLGVDASYSKELNNRNIVNINKIDSTYESAGDRIIFGIENFVNSKTKLKLYNCSIQGRLNFLQFSSEIDGVKICL
ncbi:6-hydroxymethylpterin diphosphokinase MptE-like protein [Vibrio sp. 1CM8B]|uniref:6-hydroxymethylpterin diphosphokinase MptE-like protein n=1 Tax=Vibrio sp. 1CM8B TaxID=2929167 RepID=UPI0020BE0F07|nr:6-hydroxymethylpterin diphosphokinase MptE-like protein [Vibrio sp. 1CM8B]MCK8087076.1 DUF115 domain-containing protein [Vibrio sp. 1CM8B]